MTTDAEFELMEARADREIDRLSAENERLRAELRNATADRAALDVAVTGLREMEDHYADARDEACDRMNDSDAYVAEAYGYVVQDVSALLDKIGGTR